MIALSKIRALTLRRPSAPGRPAYISAASGLVCRGGFIYVIADDELSLAVFQGNEPGTLVRLFAGTLPEDAKERKAEKPDFESLAFVPAFDDFPHGALLACGSGSRPNRTFGALIGLDAAGAVHVSPRVVDLACIMRPLGDAFPALNIEGVVVTDEHFTVFQRGNKKHSQSALVHFPLAKVLRGLSGGHRGSIMPTALHDVPLGEIKGIPLSFTDACLLPGGDMIFAAVAEDTDDAYADGLCVGAAIGRVAADGALGWINPLAGAHKVEGLSARVEGTEIKLLLVTDADDITVPADLLAATIPL